MELVKEFSVESLMSLYDLLEKFPVELVETGVYGDKHESFLKLLSSSNVLIGNESLSEGCSVTWNCGLFQYV